MGRLLRGLAAASITLALGATLTLTGSAASTGSAAALRAVSGAPTASEPNSNITGSGKALAFNPAKVSTTWSGPRSNHETCTSSNYRLTITNTTSKAQTVTYKGAAVGPAIKPKHYDYICFFGSGTVTFKLNLKADPKATLTITVS